MHNCIHFWEQFIQNLAICKWSFHNLEVNSEISFDTVIDIRRGVGVVVEGYAAIVIL